MRPVQPHIWLKVEDDFRGSYSLQQSAAGFWISFRSEIVFPPRFLISDLPMVLEPDFKSFSKLDFHPGVSKLDFSAGFKKWISSSF